jgi:threonine dehydrogenase-like Zn-dependent dehydrogenase
MKMKAITYEGVRQMSVSHQSRPKIDSPTDAILRVTTTGICGSTDPEVHANKLMELFNSGATGVHIHSGQSDQKRMIDFYGKEVLPRVRKGR